MTSKEKRDLHKHVLKECPSLVYLEKELLSTADFRAAEMLRSFGKFRSLPVGVSNSETFYVIVIIFLWCISNSIWPDLFLFLCNSNLSIPYSLWFLSYLFLSISQLYTVDNIAQNRKNVSWNISITAKPSQQIYVSRLWHCVRNGVLSTLIFPFALGQC